ncbi:hypothetical protein L6452_02333 [Arctium lappa]|uniref:Uncharacterized protein n=1 Tax=Arctium lappa TaxID=4217 RepID=A0ACB9FIK4_ARCLA|nr:hypothetical protein L6452_02333 [Arctium lappa]
MPPTTVFPSLSFSGVLSTLSDSKISAVASAFFLSDSKFSSITSVVFLSSSRDRYSCYALLASTILFLLLPGYEDP